MPLLPDSGVGHGGRFVYGVAESVKGAFESAASRVQEHSGSRTPLVSSAGEDFRGHFSEVFAANAVTASRDAESLAAALRTVAGYVGTMIERAREEDDRRRENNEWVRRHNNRNWLEQFGDSLWGEEARPNMEPGSGPSFPSEAPVPGSRVPPGPGGGFGGGVSSARPESLRTFAAGSRGLDDGVASVPGSLESELSSFADRCGWGRIDAAGVVTAFRQYLAANEADAGWALVVADAFAAAGGEGAVSTLSDAAVNEALAAAGVSGTRTGLVIDPPTAAGAMPSSGYANDPVNTATGNFIEPETDLGFAGAAADLAVTRMYNSLGSGLGTVGVFGPGWASVLDQHLAFTDEGCRWVMADGRAVDFPREGAGWARAVGENYWLTQEDAGTPWLAELTSVPEGVTEVLVVTDNQGGWWAYTTAGVWLGTGAGPGRTISAHRQEGIDGGVPGVVCRLVHVRGRFVEIDYVDGVVGVVRSSDGRRVEYGYDAEGRLTRVGTETGTRRYGWNEQGLIASVVSAAGVVEAANSYDEAGRVIMQVTQHGRRTRFAYLPGRVTVVSDEDGSRSNSWVADSKGRLVGVLDAEDRRQSMSYDGHSNLVSLTERDGAVTVHGYDTRGRKIRTVTPEGADLSYGWDEQDRITTLVTASGSVVAYEYADDLSRDPSVVLDPLGGRTELVWRDGLLTQVTDPVGVRIGFEYDEFGDVTGTSNAAGDVARIVRDRAGRPVTAVSPSGAETRFGYDEAGVLVRRVDPDGAVWAFEHDAAGRTTAVVAPDGGRTVFEYAPNGELARTTDPLGRVVERVVDELGNLTAAVLPDGASWGFTHDNLSRLVSVTDPAGHDWVREYDTVGALTAVVDPTGVRTGAVTDRAAGTASLTDAFASSILSFDEYGRPTRAEFADGSAELVSYDGAGNPVELVDGEGGLTVLGRDAAGKITSITSPTGAVTRFEYDHCGRPWKSIDPVGAVTELSYDPDQRLTARRLPTGEVETFAYDPCGRLTARHTPGEGTARYGYDKVGRLTFSQDSWYGTRRFEYNLAGELTGTVNGVGGRTRFEYDTRGRLTRITDPLGGVTTRTYTATDQVDSVTDPLGRVTTATYDPAGRQLSQTDPDGHTTTWTYDTAGREASTSVDGALIAAIERDVAGRRVVITDHTGGAGYAVEHELCFDRRGLLTRRSNGTGTGSQVLGWEYDGDGNRTAFTDPTGTTTRYIRDAAGRVLKVSNPLLGDAAFTHDPSGRITTATAGDLVQEWVYRGGNLSEHTRTTADNGTNPPGAADVTLIGREDGGRITGLSRGGVVTRYGYDTAGQMVSATTTVTDSEASGSVVGWEYDAGGRLLRETTPTGARTFEYDAAGQLLTVTDPDGARTEYVYDGLGRRVRVIGADGSWTEYAWGPTGYLTGTIEKDPDGAEQNRHRLHVDALGELATVDGTPLWWDTAAPVPTLAGANTTQVLSLPGGVTGIGDAWTTLGWRAARPTDQHDPWAVLGTPTTPNPGSPGVAHAGGLGGGLPAGIGLTAGGGIDIAGLEWLGQRAYDPATRGFLSTDPLAPVLGAGWDGNPYSYAGNNPLNTTDPTGLRPLTDADLKAYDGSSRGAIAATGDWLGHNWEYLAGGAMVVAGGVLMATGVGGPVGMMLIGAGADTIIQKATTGEVDWGQVALSGALGGFGGASIAARAGLSGMKATLVAGASSGGISGGIQGTYGYYAGPGPHTVAGALGAATQGTVFGAATGGVGGAAGQKISQGIMGAVTRNPSADTVVMGRMMDQRVHPYGGNNGYGTYTALPESFYNFTYRNLPNSVHDGIHLWANKKWINYQMMQGHEIVDIGAPSPALNPRGPGALPASNYYDMEQAEVAGYAGYRQDPQPAWDLR
ncbi:type IV secretion protein Rhs [Paenarthrobacter sp. CM16]|nr:type IV secretion protein Rhs [Paenarthrobacter sp. CM16]